jgi:hypothetical protein
MQNAARTPPTAHNGVRRPATVTLSSARSGSKKAKAPVAV